MVTSIVEKKLTFPDRGITPAQKKFILGMLDELVSAQGFTEAEIRDMLRHNIPKLRREINRVLRTSVEDTKDIITRCAIVDPKVGFCNTVTLLQKCGVVNHEHNFLCHDDTDGRITRVSNPDSTVRFLRLRAGTIIYDCKLEELLGERGLKLADFFCQTAPHLTDPNFCQQRTSIAFWNVGDVPYGSLFCYRHGQAQVCVHPRHAREGEILDSDLWVACVKT